MPLRGIRAVAVCLGAVETEWISKILANHVDPSAARRAMGERQLDGRMSRRETDVSSTEASF
jgi:meso-butanediol dehydrogenase / (S,S)-butanediol dehydrogenase / diacetyl reductase